MRKDRRRKYQLLGRDFVCARVAGAVPLAVKPDMSRRRDDPAHDGRIEEGRQFVQQREDLRPGLVKCLAAIRGENGVAHHEPFPPEQYELLCDYRDWLA